MWRKIGRRGGLALEMVAGWLRVSSCPLCGAGQRGGGGDGCGWCGYAPPRGAGGDAALVLPPARGIGVFGETLGGTAQQAGAIGLMEAGVRGQLGGQRGGPGGG